MTTRISWTDETWNPTVGCSRVSPGCDGCYAIGVAHRGMQEAHVGLTVKRPGERADWTGEVRCLTDRLDTPLRWRRPRRVFVDSMSDLFHPDVPAWFIESVWSTMAKTPQHTYQVLTKRPQRMAFWTHGHYHRNRVGVLPNVWLGTSIESEKYAWRVGRLQATMAAVRFVSAEPLLGSLADLDLADVDWLIIGGESGPQARPFDLAWARELIGAARDHGAAVFVKQLGTEWAIENGHGRTNGDEPEHWPADLRIQEFPQPAVAHA